LPDLLNTLLPLKEHFAGPGIAVSTAFFDARAIPGARSKEFVISVRNLLPVKPPYAWKKN
jgi:hypothetical protein